MIKSKIIRVINNRLGSAKFKEVRKAKRNEKKRKGVNYDDDDEQPEEEIAEEENNEAVALAEFKGRRNIVEIADGKQITIQQILEKIPSYNDFPMVSPNLLHFSHLSKNNIVMNFCRSLRSSCVFSNLVQYLLKYLKNAAAI